MRFALTREQQELQRTVRGLLERTGTAVPPTLDGGQNLSAWTRLAREVGVAGLAIPDDFGGLGASVFESMLVLEELGRTLTPSPMLGSGVLATQALLHSGDVTARSELLPGLASGERTAALAWTGPEGGWHPGSSPIEAYPTSDGSWSLDGSAHYVLDGDTADTLVVAARTDSGLGIFAVPPDRPAVEREQTPGMDLTRPLATVTFDACPARRVSGDGDGERILTRVRDLGCAALAMEQVGAAARCLDLTVEYVKQRVQFGRTIGSFQAVKHRLADLHVTVETARSAAYAAATAAAGDSDTDGIEDTENTENTENTDDAAETGHWAALAKVECSEALFAVAAEAVQLHGGIAITWEHEAQLYLKRAHGSTQLLGQPRAHVARLATSLLD